MFSVFLSALILWSPRPQVDEHIIKSEVLGYDLRYWVYVPEGSGSRKLPVLYITDGRGYTNSGEIVELSQSLTNKGRVNPHILVLVDAVDPNDPSKNRRNNQFLCNPNYLEFYKKELIPTIDKDYPSDGTRENRGILGLSFGGLNAMYFAMHGNDQFGKIGIQSPAPHPCPDIYSKFEKSPRLPIDIFLSTGTVYDKARDTRRFKGILEKKGYDFKYMEVPEGHNWKNWKPLLDDVLLYFYGSGQ